jgi:hypothetical protein
VVVEDDLSLLMRGSHQSISQHSLIHLAFPEEADEHLKDRWKYPGLRRSKRRGRRSWLISQHAPEEIGIHQEIA